MKKLLLCILIVMSASASAVTYKNGKTIKEVIVNVNSGVHFRLTESMANEEGCNSNSWYKVPSDSKYEEAAISLLLSREAQGKKVWFMLSGCESGYPKIGYIY